MGTTNPLTKMSEVKNPVSEQSLLYILLIAIAILLVAIYNDYSASLFNEFEYALSKTLGNIDNTLAGK